MRLAARAAIAAWLTLLVACVFVVSRTEFTTDLSAFLPRSPSPQQQILVDQLRVGVVSRLILVGLENAEPDRLAPLSKRLAAELRARADFVAISNGEPIAQEKDRDFLWRNRYLLSPAVDSDRFSVAGLRVALEDSLARLGSPAGIFLQRILPADPTSELLRLIEDLDGEARPQVLEGVWFTRDTRRALLVAQTRATGADIDAQETAITAIRTAFAKAAAEVGATSAKLLVTGPGVFSVKTRAQIKNDALRLSLIATALIAAMMLALYRSPRVLVLGLLPVASGALAGIAAVSVAFGSVHGITLGFGVTLIGEGVDYAIYLFTQIAPGAAAHRTFERIWPTLRLGVLTSICGFSAMLFSGFPGLAQLGLFSIAGLIVALAMTRWVLPALLPRGFSTRAPQSLAPRLEAIVQRASRLRYFGWLLIACACVYLVTLKQPLWSDDLASLNPISKAEREVDEALRREVGAPDVRHVVIVSAADEQAALETSERVGRALQSAVARGALESFQSASSYLPSTTAQRARQAAIPETQTLRSNLQRALEGLPFKPGLFDPFLRDVANVSVQPLIDRASLDGTNLALKVDSLLIKGDNGWTSMLPLRGVSDAQAIARDLSAIAPTQALLIDLKRASNDLYATYRREALDHALLGAAAIALLLIAVLRSPRRVVDVLAPLAGAVVITAAIIVLFAGALSIFHLVGLLLVVAVGSNYSLFFDRTLATIDDRGRTLVSLVFANISTVIGFGLLSFSKVPVLNAIGATVAAGAVLSLLLSAILSVRSPPIRREP